MTAPTPGNGQYTIYTSFPSSFTVTKPTGMSSGDSVVLVLFRYVNSAVTWPSGFTELLSDNDAAAETNLKIAIKENISDPSSEPASYSPSWTGNTAGAIAAGAISGIDGSDVLAGTPQSGTNFSTPMTYPSMTTDEADALVLTVGCNYDWYDMPTPSIATAWINCDDGGGNPLDVHYFTKASAGATGDQDITVDGSALWIAAQIAFKPTSGATEYPISLSGSITPTGSLGKQVGKPITGSVTPGGSLVKQIATAVVGTITPTGSLSVIKSFIISLGGAITPTGATQNSISKILAGSIVPTGAVQRLTAITRTGSITPGGALSMIRVILLDVAGQITPSGALTRSVSIIFASSLSLAGSVINAVSVSLTGTITPAGNLTVVTGAISSVITKFKGMWRGMRKGMS